MKGKGYEVTARNIAGEEETELCRPLTTDPMDNALLTDETEDTTGDKEGI